MKSDRGSRGIAPLSFNLGIRYAGGGGVVTSRVSRFTPEKEPRYPLNRWLGGPQSLCGRSGEGKNVYPTGIRALAVYS
jgi:hypothetical protein